MADEHNQDDDPFDGDEDDLDAYIKERDTREQGFAGLVAAAERRIERGIKLPSGQVMKADPTKVSQD